MNYLQHLLIYVRFPQGKYSLKQISDLLANSEARLFNNDVNQMVCGFGVVERKGRCSTKISQYNSSSPLLPLMTDTILPVYLHNL